MKKIMNVIKKIKYKKIIILLGFILIILAAIFLLKKENNKIIYINSNNDLVMIDSNAKDTSDYIKISDNYNTNQILLTQNNKYIFYNADNILYRFNISNEKTEKISDNVQKYFFTDNEKFLIILDTDKRLYSYNLKKLEMLAEGIQNIVQYNNEYIIYEKGENLYYKDIKNVRSETKISDKFQNITLTPKNKLIYLEDNNMNIYNLEKRKTIFSQKDVQSYYCIDECEKFYFTNSQNGKLYFYDKKEFLITDTNCFGIYDIDVENKLIVYATYENEKLNLYYSINNKNTIKIAEDVGYMAKAKIISENQIYYTDLNGNLNYVEISNNKIKKSSQILSSKNNYINLEKYQSKLFVATTEDYISGEIYIFDREKEIIGENDIVINNVDFDENRIIYSILKNETYTTYVYNDKKTKIDTNIAQYIEVDNAIIYIKTSNEKITLNRYKNNKSVEITGDAISLIK